VQQGKENQILVYCFGGRDDKEKKIKKKEINKIIIALSTMITFP